VKTKISRPVAELLAIRLILVVLIALVAGPKAREGKGLGVDTTRYHQIATARGTPYRDFDVEYPPLAYFELKAVHGSTPQQTASHLAWVQFALDAATAIAILVAWGEAAAVAYLVLTMVFVPLIYLELEPLVLALAVVGLALIEKGKERSGGVLLAAAAFAKIWPVLLLPVLAARSRWRALRYSVVAGGIGLTAWVAWAGLGAPLAVLRFRGLDGWTTGSAGGVLLRLFARSPIRYVGDMNRVGTLASWVSPALFLVVAAVAMWAAWAARRNGRWPVAALLMVGATLLLSPIFSYQYVIWLVPFAAICGERRLQVLTFVAVVISAALLAWVSVTAAGGPLLDWSEAAKVVAVLVVAVGAARALASSPASSSAVPVESVVAR
jgi:hypothetical protein